MAGIMDTLKNVANDGAFLSIASVAVVAGLGAANQAGFYDKIPVKIPGVGSGSSNDDAWWGEGQGQGQGQGQWESFGQEFEDYGSSNGSRSHGSKKGSKKKGSKRKASAYNQFVGQRIPQLTAQGYSAKDAMKTAAKEWSSGGGW